MDGQLINRDYINLIMENPSRYLDDYHKTMERVGKSSAQYRGQPIPTLYHPMFIGR